jgi:hypothetical protein
LRVYADDCDTVIIPSWDYGYFVDNSLLIGQQPSITSTRRPAGTLPTIRGVFITCGSIATSPLWRIGILRSVSSLIVLPWYQTNLTRLCSIVRNI